MLRNKIVIVGAGSLLLLAGAAGASAQGHASDRTLTAAGRVAGVRVATTVATAAKPLAASTGHRTAAPVRTVKSSAKANNGQSGQDEQGDNENENERECSTTLPGGTETDGQDDQGENERDQQCSTAAGQPQGQDEHGSTTNENDHESGDSQHGSGGGDQGGSGDQGDGSGGGGD